MDELLQKIDRYIEESLDENFDRYLEQMKEILGQHPEQMEDVARSVEENMERYRLNQAALMGPEGAEEPAEPEDLEEPEKPADVEGAEEPAEPEDLEEPEKPADVEGAEEPAEPEDMGELSEPEGPEGAGEPSEPEEQEEPSAPVDRPEGALANSQGNSMEFKIGIGVLSAIGVLFVLVGMVILIRNFLPDVVQGMMMMCFFALVWILSQLCLSRFAQKLSLGCTAAGITGMYLSVTLNYYVFESFSDWMACGLFILVGIIAWAAGRASHSAVIQCTGAVGFLLFWPFIPWGDGIPAFIVVLAVTVVLNVLWQLGASGKYTYVVRMTHQITFIFSAMAFEIMLALWELSEGMSRAFIYSVVVVALVNLFYLKREDTGFFVVWLCGMVFHLVFLFEMWIVNWFIGDSWWNCLLLAPAAANVAFLFAVKFRWRYQFFYYQAAGLLLLMSVCDKVWWIGLAATVLLFLLGLWKIREHQLLQEMFMLAVLSAEILMIPTDYSFLVSLLLMALAIIAVIAGFARWEMPLRVYGLCLSLFACGKVVLYDFWDLKLLQKSLLFVGVGLIAIAIAVIYAVLEHQQKKHRNQNFH